MDLKDRVDLTIEFLRLKEEANTASSRAVDARDTGPDWGISQDIIDQKAEDYQRKAETYRAFLDTHRDFKSIEHHEALTLLLGALTRTVCEVSCFTACSKELS